LNRKAVRTEIPNHLSADTGLDCNGLDWLDAKPPKDVPDGSGAGFSLSLEESVAIGINKADGGLEVSGVEADPVALVPWHSIPMRISFLSALVMSFRALAD
jgi:hypothetical protein